MGTAVWRRGINTRNGIRIDRIWAGSASRFLCLRQALAACRSFFTDQFDYQIDLVRRYTHTRALEGVDDGIDLASLTERASDKFVGQQIDR